ncbi:MAG: hypothetical protein AB7T49_02750 [Oligoflexales bacterium]
MLRLITCVFLGFLFSTSSAFADGSVRLAAMPVGFDPYPGGGISASYALSEQLTAEVNYMGHQSNWTGPSAFVHQYTKVIARYSPSSGSFNVAFGPTVVNEHLNFYSADGFWSGYDGIDNVKAKGSLITTSQSLAVFAGIGHRWVIKHFMVGADWVGYVQNVAAISSPTITDSDDTDETRDGAVKAAKKRQKSAGYPILGVLYLGAAF